MPRRRLGFDAAGQPARPGPRVSAEELRAFLHAPLPGVATPAIPLGPPHSEADLPLPLTGLFYHNLIVVSNKLPRRKASEILAEGAGAADGGNGGMDDSEDMDISDEADTEP